MNLSVTGPSDFGPGSGTIASGGAGDDVGFCRCFNTSNPPALIVPVGYISETPLSESAIYNGATLSSLGATPGTYVWTWGSGADQSFTLEIEAPTAAPLPAALPLFATGLGGLGLLGWRRKRKQAA